MAGMAGHTPMIAKDARRCRGLSCCLGRDCRRRHVRKRSAIRIRYGSTSTSKFVCCAAMVKKRSSACATVSSIGKFIRRVASICATFAAQRASEAASQSERDQGCRVCAKHDRLRQSATRGVKLIEFSCAIVYIGHRGFSFPTMVASRRGSSVERRATAHFSPHSKFRSPSVRNNRARGLTRQADHDQMKEAAN